MICPICSSQNLRPFLSREAVPVHQNLVMKEEALAKNISKGKLTLLHCEECDFVFNSSFEVDKLDYGALYDNTQELSPVFKAHIERTAQELLENKKIQNATVVEVGCGKGGFLKLLIENERYGNRGFGFDPTYVGETSLFNGRLQFKKCFYDESVALDNVDVIVCRHVIEHIQNPRTFLEGIRKTLNHSSHVRLFFETPCLEWILKNRIIWDFFYEHTSYFTPTCLKTIFEKAGFQVESVEHVFEGQYLWLEATLKKDLKTLLKDYQMSEKSQIDSWKEILKKEKTKMAIWGAGAKGVTFANLVDPKRELFDSVIDINPQKQGFFLPGSGHPIVNYNTAFERGVRKAFLMNSNYKNESLSMLAKENIQIDLIDAFEETMGRTG